MSGESSINGPERPRAGSTGWSRSHTIWTLIVLNLIPGAVIALFRDEWEKLNTGLQWATYAACAILILGAVVMMLSPDDKGS